VARARRPRLLEGWPLDDVVSACCRIDIISRPPFWRPRTFWATPKEARATGAAEAEERRAAGVHLGAVHRAAALREVVRERRVAVADTPEAGRSSRDPASSAVRTGRDDSPADKHKAARTTRVRPRSRGGRLRLQCG
jgi:hypothetical protein